jgi:hypothetical protein
VLWRVVRRSGIGYQGVSVYRDLSSSELTHSCESDTKRVLVFNCTNGRSGSSLLRALLSTIEKKLGTSDPQTLATFFEHVIFCTNVTYSSGEWKPGGLFVHLPPMTVTD